jgi:hypothetical protein
VIIPLSSWAVKHPPPHRLASRTTDPSL